MARLTLDLYGLRIGIESAWTEVVEALRDDFAWFENEVWNVDLELRVERVPPDYELLEPVVASFVTPRNVVYHRDGRTLVDYFGNALALVDRDRREVVIQGEQEHLVHEAAYLLVLSRAGEHLDAHGLTRLHGLGLSSAVGAVVLTLPSGGGKTTMALMALREGGVRLLSEDTPLLDRRGLVHPFPLRIGVNEPDAYRLPPGPQRRVERMEFQPKVLLSATAFLNRIESDPQPLAHLVIGQRTLGREARLERVVRRAAIGPMLREAVIGVGIYQGMEFVLQRGARDVLAKGGVAARRAFRCAAGLRRATVWRLTIGRDGDRNWQALVPLLEGSRQEAQRSLR